MKTWLKGGLIGLITFPILTIIINKLLDFILNKETLLIVYLHDLISRPLRILIQIDIGIGGDILLGVIALLIEGFVIGALIGWIIQKIKSH